MDIHIPGSSRRREGYPTCEKCGSENVARIAYGLPTNESFYDARIFGDVVFGGCIIGAERKSWHCKDCSHSWNRLAVARETETPTEPQPVPDMRKNLKRRGDDPVNEYYRDRHARRHGFEPPAMAEFEVDCWGLKHRVILTGHGRLIFPDHQNDIIPYPEDSEMSCMKLLGMWRQRRMDEAAPVEAARVHWLVRTREKLKPVHPDFGDPLMRPVSARIRNDAERANGLANVIIKDWLKRNLSELNNEDHVWLVVKSRTLNFVRTQRNGRSIKVNIGLHNSRRWMYRVYDKGWAVLGGYFIFEVKEVISDDRMRVLALRETAPFELAIEEAVAVRDGEWRVNFESGS